MKGTGMNAQEMKFKCTRCGAEMEGIMFFSSKEAESPKSRFDPSNIEAIQLKLESIENFKKLKNYIKDDKVFTITYLSEIGKISKDDIAQLIYILMKMYLIRKGNRGYRKTELMEAVFHDWEQKKLVQYL